MTTTCFAILFVVVMISIIAMLLLSVSLIPTVKAGKVDKFCFRYELSEGQKSDKVINGDHVLSIQGLSMFAVRGNSMFDYGIRDCSHVYVKPLSIEEKNNITTRPVIVFDIENGPKIQSFYKLRKFVDYIDNIETADWTITYNKLKENFNIKLSEESFVQMLNQKVAKIANKSGRFVLSETYNEDSLVYEYSLHPVNSIYGKVRYVS